MALKRKIEGAGFFAEKTGLDRSFIFRAKFRLFNLMSSNFWRRLSQPEKHDEFDNYVLGQNE